HRKDTGTANRWIHHGDTARFRHGGTANCSPQRRGELHLQREGRGKPEAPVPPCSCLAVSPSRRGETVVHLSIVAVSSSSPFQPLLYDRLLHHVMFELLFRCKGRTVSPAPGPEPEDGCDGGDELGDRKRPPDPLVRERGAVRQ